MKEKKVIQERITTIKVKEDLKMLKRRDKVQDLAMNRIHPELLQEMKTGPMKVQNLQVHHQEVVVEVIMGAAVAGVVLPVQAGEVVLVEADLPEEVNFQ